VVVCKVPKAGLGNQLFPIMKAFTFGHINRLPVIVTGYNQFKIGPYLRKEKIKRNYQGYFKFQKNYFKEQADKWRLRKNKNFQISSEPCLQEVKADNATPRQIYVFSEIPHWDDYFVQLKNYRETVISIFNDLVSENIKEKIALQKSPCIGVHIRMGDFRKLKAGENFSMVGAVRTPEDYFINLIISIRKIHGSQLPVSVFTDGYQHEFEKLFLLDHIKLIEGNPDLVDMILLSKSKIIIASAGSTFSYWAGFLANAPLILHPDHIHQPIRPAEINNNWYEGDWDSNNEVLVNNIYNIQWS
jgi:hypothetical protein